MASKNVSDGKVNLAATAFKATSAADFTAWLDDPKNYVDRSVNGRKQSMRRTCSLSANFPDDIYYQAVHSAAGEKGRLDDGDMTYMLRNAVWLYLGYTQDVYAAWAEAERARITEELKARMGGVSTERQAKIKETEAENASLKTQLEELKAMLAKLQTAS